MAMGHGCCRPSSAPVTAFADAPRAGVRTHEGEGASNSGQRTAHEASGAVGGRSRVYTTTAVVTNDAAADRAVRGLGVKAPDAKGADPPRGSGSSGGDSDDEGPGSAVSSPAASHSRARTRGQRRAVSEEEEEEEAEGDNELEEDTEPAPPSLLQLPGAADPLAVAAPGSATARSAASRTTAGPVQLEEIPRAGNPDYWQVLLSLSFSLPGLFVQDRRQHGRHDRVTVTAKHSIRAG